MYTVVIRCKECSTPLAQSEPVPRDEIESMMEFICNENAGIDCENCNSVIFNIFVMTGDNKEIPLEDFRKSQHI